MKHLIASPKVVLTISMGVTGTMMGCSIYWWSSQKKNAPFIEKENILCISTKYIQQKNNNNFEYHLCDHITVNRKESFDTNKVSNIFKLDVLFQAKKTEVHEITKWQQKQTPNFIFYWYSTLIPKTNDNIEKDLFLIDCSVSNKDEDIQKLIALIEEFRKEQDQKPITPSPIVDNLPNQ